MSNVALAFSELRQGRGRAPRCSQPQRDPPAALTSSPGACGSCESRPPMELPQPHASELPDACLCGSRASPPPAELPGACVQELCAVAMSAAGAARPRPPGGARWRTSEVSDRSLRSPRLITPPHRQRARLGPGDSDLQGTSTCAACAVAPHKESGS